MRTVRSGAAIGLVAQLVLLAGLGVTVGLAGPGWVVGVACGVTSNGALARALIRDGAGALRPGDWITLIRATLVGGLAALVADSFSRPIPLAIMVGLASLAVVLDAVDGWVARRTETTSTVGARFDSEVDAFLIFVLAVYAARLVGGWVLVIGAARYVFVAAGWLFPWLREPTPYRYWCKVVAAIQGISLTVAMADILPRPFITVALVIALLLLTESFGRSVWWLWRHRPIPADTPGAAAKVDDRSRVRRAAARVITVLACLLVWFALVAPNQLSRIEPGVFLRIPVEGLVLLALVLVLPQRAGRLLAVLVGVVLGLLTVVKILDMGFFEALDRPFNPVSDWGYVGPAVGLLVDSIGLGAAIASVIAAAAVVIGLVVLVPLSVRRVTRLAAGHRPTSSRFITAFGVLWIVSALIGVQTASGAPIASAGAVDLAYDQVTQIRTGVQDQASFSTAISHDPLSITPQDKLLTALRGKDVIFAFVESYGRVAVQDSAFSPAVDAVLDAATTSLRTAGYAAKSAFLTSPTFGGISWLAHSTFQSGVWVDSQQRYDELVASSRFTLSDAFKRAGWRTVVEIPSNNTDWPEGTSFYHYDKIYDSRTLGYDGPNFSYATMPDQYTLLQLHRTELADPGHPPVMVEVDLVSSHTPWAPLPRMVPWTEVGDGSVFDPMPAQGQVPSAVWKDADQVRAAYGQSIQYSLTALTSFVENYGNDNLVVVLMGDHQPATTVTGDGATHDVPITIIAHDPAVMDRVSGWGWQDGMNPSPQAPVWPMDAFRDRFLGAFGG